MSDLIKVDNGTVLLDKATAEKIAEFELQMKYYKAQQDELKAAILAEMEAKNIIKVDNDILTISYIASTDRETLDSKKLRLNYPTFTTSTLRYSPLRQV